MPRTSRSTHLLSSLALATSLALGGCAGAPVDRPATTVNARAVQAFFADFSDEWMMRQPAAATGSRYFEGATQAALDRQLTPQDDAFERETIALARRGLERLAGYDRAAMSDEERVSADLLQWQLQTLIDNARFRDYQFPLNQFGGSNVGLPNLMTVVHPLATADDADNYIARLGLIDTRMEETVQRTEALAARGILPPRFILQSTIAQMRQFISPEPAANPLVTTLASRIGDIDGLDDERGATLVEQATVIVASQVYPAWRKAIEALEAQLPAATDDAGLWRFEHGAEAYALRLHQFTSTSLGAEEIHAIGLREVARIETEMDRILRSIGRNEGSVRERVDALKRDLAYSNDDAGRTAIMDDIETMMRDAERRADSVFDIRPKTPVIARPYPEYRWASAAASYTAPPLDGSRPGVYQMPLRPDRLTRFGLRTLVYHETVPGHHFQIALSVENRALPKFRQARTFGGISAYSEGWALYSERLAAEEGWYEGDLEGLLGQLDAELFRARRLVVDTGLHAMRWTRQQAIDYGISPSEVERYVVMPGQATSYMVGQLEIIRLRDKARAALGDDFDPKQFHNHVLLTGMVPLVMLEQEVDAWIASVRARG